MATGHDTSAPSHGCGVSRLEAAVIHRVGQSRAFVLQAEAATHEISSLRDELAARVVEALEMTLAKPTRPGTLRHVEQAATTVLFSLREAERQ